MEKLAISISLTIVVQLFDYLTIISNSLLELLKNNSQEGKVSANTPSDYASQHGDKARRVRPIYSFPEKQQEDWILELRRD